MSNKLAYKIHKVSNVKPSHVHRVINTILNLSIIDYENTGVIPTPYGDIVYDKHLGKYVVSKPSKILLELPDSPTFTHVDDSTLIDVLESI